MANFEEGNSNWSDVTLNSRPWRSERTWHGREDAAPMALFSIAGADSDDESRSEVEKDLSNQPEPDELDYLRNERDVDPKSDACAQSEREWDPCIQTKLPEGFEDSESRNLELHALQKWPSYRQLLSELSKQKNIGGPIAAMNLMWFSRFTISTLFLGHLGAVELAGGTMALTYANVTGFSILIGLAGGMEPVCSQAYGAKRYMIMGLALQRGILILLLASFPVAILWLNVERVLLLFGQDPAICALAKHYLHHLLPDLLATAILSPLRIYLRSQCITVPMLWCSAIAMSLHIPINLLLVFVFKFGAAGTALATCWTDFNLIIMLLTYIRRTGIHASSWPGWSKASLEDWLPFMRMAGPTCLMTCLEWWCYETMTLLTGLLPDANKAVATMAIVLNGDTIFYALQAALGSSVSTRVGNELGANSPIAAYHASLASLSLSLALACFGAAWLISTRNIWGKLFTSDQKILLEVGRLLPILGLCELGNFPQTVCCGVLRGSARPAMGAFANLGAFYLVGIPLGIILAFNLKLGLLGLWLGLLAAVLTCAALTVTAVLRTDWILEGMRAQQLNLSAHGDSCSLSGSNSADLCPVLPPTAAPSPIVRAGHHIISIQKPSLRAPSPSFAEPVYQPISTKAPL